MIQLLSNSRKSILLRQLYSSLDNGYKYFVVIKLLWILGYKRTKGWLLVATSWQISRYGNHGVSTYHIPINTIRSILVHPKDRTPDANKCGVIYQFSCPECPDMYVGETSRSLKTRFKEHSRLKASHCDCLTFRESQSQDQDRWCTSRCKGRQLMVTEDKRDHWNTQPAAST